MAIANSCYIRKISKKDQASLKKVGERFRINTTPAILMKLLSEWFLDQNRKEEQSDTIRKLKGQLFEAQEELKNYKKEVKLFLNTEIELEKQKSNLLKTV